MSDGEPPSSAIDSQQADHLPTLDGWRAVAILSVMMHHGADSIRKQFGGWLGVIASEFYDHGRWGVNVFFGISGFLICSRLLGERRKYGDISLGGFYIRRASRILPPLLAFLAVVGVLGLAGIIPINVDHWLSALGFFADYYPGPQTWYVGHFWSLAIEEHFYLFWPLIVASFGVRRSLRIGIGLALIVGIWRSCDLVFEVFPNPPPITRTDTQLDGLMWGCVFAILYSQPNWRAKLKSLTAGWQLAACLSLVAGVVGALILGSKAVGYLPRAGYFKVWASAPLAFVTPLLLVSTVLKPRGWLGRVLEFPPLQWVGRLSYSLYLWQQLFLVWNKWRAPAMSPMQNFPLNFALSLVCAIASYYLLERPVVAYGARLSRSVRRGSMRPVPQV